MNIRRCLALVFFMIVTFLSVGCSPTNLAGNWKKTNYTDKPSKVLILGLSKSEAYRRIFENDFAAALEKSGIKAFPGHVAINYDKNPEKEVIVKYVTDNNIDSVIVTSLISEKTQRQRIAMISDHLTPTGYTAGGWYGDYFMGHMSVVSYNQKVDVYNFETNLYTVEGEELVWIAITRTEAFDRDPKNVKDIVKVLIKQLKKDELI